MGAKDSQGFAMPEETSLTDVLVACTKAAGGSKVVGARMFPDLLIEQAQRKLLDCLNDDRPHRLTPDQVLLVADMARAAGCHAFMEHCAARLHYQPPVPREPRDELAELQRSFVAAMAQLPQLAAQIQALQAQVGPVPLKAVA